MELFAKIWGGAFIASLLAVLIYSMWANPRMTAEVTLTVFLFLFAIGGFTSFMLWVSGGLK